jgi:hypothetical protein
LGFATFIRFAGAGRILLAFNRLQITAGVDLAGLKKLEQMLAKYKEILKMLPWKRPPTEAAYRSALYGAQIGRLVAVEIAREPAVPLHFDFSANLNDGALLVAIVPGNALSWPQSQEPWCGVRHASETSALCSECNVGQEP